jgi:hypothetical protein
VRGVSAESDDYHELAGEVRTSRVAFALGILFGALVLWAGAHL